MFKSDIPDDWEPAPPPETGSSRWKDDIAFQMVLSATNLETQGIYKLPDYEGHYLGYFIVQRGGGGIDYFRTEDIKELT